MSLTRVQFQNNFNTFSYVLIFILLFGVFNILNNKIEYKILLFIGISLGITYFFYNNNKQSEINAELNDKNDLKIFNTVDAPYFKNDQFFFDFFRKNKYIKEVNLYTWNEIIKHSDNFIKTVKLMDTEIKNKHQLLDIAKMEKNKILSLFSSFIVSRPPGTLNIDSTITDSEYINREREILKAELDFYYGEMVKKSLLEWKDNINITNKPIMDETVSAYNIDFKENLDLYS
tara:strand:+ start:61 stop:753 length:693 start_codon:yes stop_codon:yes gene_type:complete